VILITVVLSRALANPDGLLPLIQILKVAALGGEIAISVIVIRWLARRSCHAKRDGVGGEQDAVIHRKDIGSVLPHHQNKRHSLLAVN
jgi:hypothetical protein